MLLNAYTIYDRKSLIYNTPFFAPTDGAAVRMLSDLANDANTSIGRHPSDYVMYFIGSYSDFNASLEPESPLRHVMDAEALLRLQPDLFGGPAKSAPLGAANGHVENINRGDK